MSTARTLHLIDIENLAGGSRMTTSSVQRLWQAYSGHAVRLGAKDHVVVGTGVTAAPAAWFGMPASIQRVVGHGPDGAELAIIGAVDLRHAAARYDRVVVASGDHLFAPFIQEARSLGLLVEAVFGRGCPSRELLAACPKRTWIGERGRSRLDLYRDAQQEQRLRRLELALAM